MNSPLLRRANITLRFKLTAYPFSATWIGLALAAKLSHVNIMKRNEDS